MRVLFILLVLASESVHGEGLILTSKGIGDLALSESTLVNKNIVEDKFPQYKVKTGIGQGDSPDFHWIKIFTKTGELIFTIYSYFDESVNESTKKFDIDLLVVSSSLVKDEYEVKVGDSLEKVISLRGKGLEFGANHYDNYLGKNKIYYGFQVALDEATRKTGVGYMNPDGVTFEYALKDNPKIDRISWPGPSWD